MSLSRIADRFTGRERLLFIAKNSITERQESVTIDFDTASEVAEAYATWVKDKIDFLESRMEQAESNG